MYECFCFPRVYVVLINFQTEKKDSAIQAQTILVTAVLDALSSTLERNQHFCMVTICSSHCAQICGMCVWGEVDVNQPLSHVCQPTGFKPHLGTGILHLSLNQRDRENKKHQKEGTVKWSKKLARSYRPPAFQRVMFLTAGKERTGTPLPKAEQLLSLCP